MKKLIVVGLGAFVLGLFVATLLKTSYAQVEDTLSHVQLLVVKIASTISLIMLIIGGLCLEYRHLFAKKHRKQRPTEQQNPTPNTSSNETPLLRRAR